ncbi:YolD-like family protein [Neobacillus notoginsengisoli]|uniref:YolD-like family protein n=1 Tax=Neobacillus notoginsengisoli TaxID=1578198 RepID=A0A417YVC4_9BACI|nr:YolD-like family protein [Neobacillus notoginsengisoli]RHW41162.1 YolD-like family protein [Neobacillus notoginsengisoli]
MIRDRGRIKWTSMMLPEHVKMLRDWVKEDSYEQKKELDEQQLEMMNETLMEAMEFNQAVAITYYRGRNYERCTGNVHYWDELAHKLHMIDSSGNAHLIPINTIADIRLAEK